jgi:CHAT domain-containing protein/tetratricopeptide (TPR) repeat protein
MFLSSPGTSQKPDTHDSIFGEEQRDRILALIDSVHATTQPDRVQALIDSFLPLAQAGKDTALILPLILRRGFEYTTFGDGVRGEPFLREAADLALARQDSSQLTTALRWLGLAVSSQGRFEEAEAIYDELCGLARLIGHKSNEGWAHVGLGWIAERTGRFETSCEEYEAAIALFREIEEIPGELWAMSGLGTALQEKGDSAARRRIYSRVVELSHKHGFLAQEGLALNNLGTISYALSDYESALGYFERAAVLHREAGIPRAAIISDHNICDCLVLLGRYSKAVAILEPLLAECRERGYADLEIMIQNAIGSIHVEQGRYRRGAGLFRKGIDPSKSYPVNCVIDSYRGLSEALAHMDSSAAGLAVLEEALERSGIEQSMGKQSLLVSNLGARLLELGRFDEHVSRIPPHLEYARDTGRRLDVIRLSTQLARSYRSLDQSDSALAYLQSAAEAWGAVREIPLDPEWREQYGEVGRLLYVQLAELLISGEAAVSSGIGSAFDELQFFKSRTLLERMRAPEDGQVVNSPQDRLGLVTLNRMQADVLDEDELLLDAYVGPERSLLFAVTKDECRTAPFLGEKELGDLVASYWDLTATPEEGLNTMGSAQARRLVKRDLYEELTAGITDMLAGHHRVLIAPDGPLHLVPFADLFNNVGPDSAATGDSVVVQCVRVPSATIFADLRLNQGRIDSRLPGRILALAHRPRDAGRSIPGAIRETRALQADYSNVELRIIETGSKQSVIEDLDMFEVLHIAAHAVINNEAPWKSEIQFGAHGAPQNLPASRIAAMDLPARLVVLSSCESARGRILGGEGVLGLSNAFLSTGVSSVIATLWPVDDNSTAVFMKSFYDNLAAGRTVSSSLASARVALRDRPETSHPFFWAGFTLVGDGDFVIPLERKGGPDFTSLLIGSLLAGSIVLSAVIIATRRRRLK